MSNEAKKDKTIIITVKLKGALGACKLYGKGYLGEGRWAVPMETRIEVLIDLLSLPKDLTGIIFVNGRRVEKDKILRDGEVVEFFPPIGGG
jgi:sulfur carrier protein ThiS